MDTNTILLLLITGTLNVVCFFIGAKIGQKTSKGEPIEMPTVNPIKAFRERENERVTKRELDKLETLLHNIDVYDGTSMGQKDVSR